MKKNTKLILGVVVLVVVVAVLLGVYFGTRPGTTQGAKTITVEVVHADGSTKTFTYHTDEEYLAEVLLAEELVSGTEDQYGLYVLEVDGEKAIWEESGAYWGLMVNGEYAMQGVSQTPVNDGDAYSLVYTVG